MGKPKALRNRDVLPTITLDKKPNKRTNFDADPEEDAGNQVVDAVVKKGGKVAEAVVDEPEEIAADSAEVLRMKELHESMVESYTRKSKRRKITLAPTSTADADTKLDNDVFAAFGDESGDENSSDEEDAASDDGTGWTIDVRKSNSRKIDGLEVTVLSESATLDPIKSFELSDKVKNFQKNSYAKNARVKYMNFVTQKKGGPSKQFAVK